MMETSLVGDDSEDVENEVDRRHVNIIARADKTLSVPPFQALIHCFREKNPQKRFRVGLHRRRPIREDILS